MKYPIFVVALLAITTGCWDEPKVKTWANATGPEAHERLLWQSVKEQNWQELEAHLSSTFVAMNAQGVLDRAQTMQHFKSLHIDDCSIGDLESRPNGSVMVVTYTMTAHGSFDGKPFSVDQVRMMTVWQQVKNGWIAIAHSDSGK